MSLTLSDMTRPETSGSGTDRRLFLRVLLYALLFKLLIVAILPLGVDEAYATAVAQEFSLSFFDHPPLSFWMPVAFARILGVENAFVYRLPFLISGVVTTATMFSLGRELAGTRAGLWSAVLFAMAPFFLVSAGFLVVPDGPLSLGLALSALFLVQIVKSGTRAPLRLWIYTGLALAFALASKYQAAWLPVAVLIFMVTTRQGRRWFLQSGPWLAAAIGLTGLAPVILWNAQHDWVSFAFHTSRAGDGFNLKNLSFMLLGQLIYLLPPTMLVSVTALWDAFRHPIKPERLLLALIALGPILIFNYVYLTSHSSHAHWSMPGWQLALPLAGVWLAERPRRALRRFWRWSIAFMVMIWVPLLILAIQADTGIFTRAFYARPPKWDNTISINGLTGLRPALKARGLWATSDVVMAETWAWAGRIDAALGFEKPMRIIDPVGAHHYVYLSDAKAHGRALLILPVVLIDQKAAAAQALAQARTLDKEAQLLPPIILDRGAQPYIAVVLVRLRLH